MMQSNFEILKTSTPRKPELITRLAWLEQTAKELREYSKKARKAKKTLCLCLAVQYESLADTLRVKIESKTLI